MTSPVKPHTKPRKVKYLSNTNLLAQIKVSKDSYCAYLDETCSTYTLIIEAKPSQSALQALEGVAGCEVTNHEGRVVLDALGEPLRVIIGSIVRVHTWEHVPELQDGAAPSRRRKNKTLEHCSFPPFQHYRLTEMGWELVGRSHWQGGVHNGHFSNVHGRMTDELAKMIWLLIKRYASKPSWSGYSYRDEMEACALENLMAVGLQFDESRTQNPFAFYTTCVANQFRRVWRQENNQQNIRDDMLILNGAAPSITRQLRDEAAQAGVIEPPEKKKAGRPRNNPLEPPKPKRGVGRPRKVREDA